MNGRSDESGWMSMWTDGCVKMDELMDLYSWMDGWMDVWEDKWMDRRMDGRRDGGRYTFQSCWTGSCSFFFCRRLSGRACRWMCTRCHGNRSCHAQCRHLRRPRLRRPHLSRLLCRRRFFLFALAKNKYHVSL